MLTIMMALTISNIIKKQAPAFELFLKTQILDKQIWGIITEISKQSDIYVLSGVIRDFLTGNFSGVRDLDFVLTRSESFTHLLNILQSMTSVEIRRNHFGGIKLKTKEFQIDLWYLEDTWGIKKRGLPANANSLIHSVFFNFSAITFALNEKKFIFNDDFCRFLKTNVLDVVYEENPNIPLCIINTFHYSFLFNYNISVSLAKWIQKHYEKGMDFIKIQEEHFGCVLYAQKNIELFVGNIIKQLL